MNDADEMSARNDLAERLDRLETRVMYQDDTIEILNQTITAQWREIDVLKRQISQLKQRLEEAEAGAEGPRNEPPPHY
jgi:SlyX protein